MQKNKRLSVLIWLIIFFVVLFSLVNSFQLTLNDSSSMQYSYYLSLNKQNDGDLGLIPNPNLTITQLRVKTITGGELFKFNLNQKIDYQDMLKYNDYLNILHVSKMDKNKSDWKIIYVMAISLSGVIFIGFTVLRAIILFIIK